MGSMSEPRTVLPALTIDDLRRKVVAWEMYHMFQLGHESVSERTRFREKRDAIGRELEALGFVPVYVDDTLMLIVH